MNTSDVRDILQRKLADRDIRPNGTVEIQNAHFICDKSYIIDGLAVADIDLSWYEKNYDPIIDRGDQINNVVDKLVDDPYSRQAVICMASPEDHIDGNPGYICTMYMQALLDGDTLKYIVNMRSNDVARFPVDYKWQSLIYRRIVDELSAKTGKQVKMLPIEWNAGSLHIYEKDFKYLSKLYKN